MEHICLAGTILSKEHENFILKDSQGQIID